MKKLVGIMAGGLLALGLAGKANAAAFGNIELQVSLGNTLSVAIVGSTVSAFGSVSAGASAVSGSGILVDNDSGALIETYTLNGNDSAPWLLVASAGINQYALRGLFNLPASAAPLTGAFDNNTDKILVAPTAASTAAGAGNFEGDASGFNVNPASQRRVWFKIFTPTSTTSGGFRQLTVSIVAQPGS